MALKSDLEKALEHITEQIKRYREAKVMDGESLNTILKEVSATLFYLESERAKYHNQYQNTVHKLVINKTPVNRAENEAHVLVPEMYLLRRIMDSAYTCVDAIRTNISYLKSEKQNSKN